VAKKKAVAKAGTGKGNAFTAPGHSYEHQELCRRAAADAAVPTPAWLREKEDSIRAIIDCIS